MRRFFILLSVFCLAISLTACPSTEQSLLEGIKFNMDRCNPSDDSTDVYCENAATEADRLVAEDTSNAEYALLASQAYFAKANLDLLELAGEMAGLGDDLAGELSDIRTIACVFATVAPDMDDLAASRARLETLQTNIGATAFAEEGSAAFQLGLVQSLEAYILPSVEGANPGSTEDCINTAFDLTDIENLTEADVTTIRNDLIAADNNFIDSGLGDDNEMVSVLRDYWCRLNLQPAGFNLGILKAFTYCQLLPGSEDNTVEGIISVLDDVTGYAGEIANGCLAFLGNSLAGFSACTGQNTE